MNNTEITTTNNMIVDYLFYQSIQSRLIEKESSTKDKNVIEKVIEGEKEKEEVDID